MGGEIANDIYELINGGRFIKWAPAAAIASGTMTAFLHILTSCLQGVYYVTEQMRTGRCWQRRMVASSTTMTRR